MESFDDENDDADEEKETGVDDEDDEEAEKEEEKEEAAEEEDDDGESPSEGDELEERDRSWCKDAHWAWAVPCKWGVSSVKETKRTGNT